MGRRGQGGILNDCPHPLSATWYEMCPELALAPDQIQLLLWDWLVPVAAPEVKEGPWGSVRDVGLEPSTSS